MYNKTLTLYNGVTISQLGGLAIKNKCNSFNFQITKIVHQQN